MSIHQAKPEHEIAYQDLCKLLAHHGDKVTALEMLAIASNMVGKLVAMQDQRTVTPGMAMEVVAKNVEAGNQDIVAQLGKSQGAA